VEHVGTHLHPAVPNRRFQKGFDRAWMALYYKDSHDTLPIFPLLGFRTRKRSRDGLSILATSREEVLVRVTMDPLQQ
jgi:hypothetical protein